MSLTLEYLLFLRTRTLESALETLRSLRPAEAILAAEVEAVDRDRDGGRGRRRKATSGGPRRRRQGAAENR